MQYYTICFMATGGVTIKAKSYDDAVKKFWEDEKIQESVGQILAENGIDVTEVYEDEDYDD